MKNCIKCGSKIPSTITVDRKKRNLANRRYCFVCSPFRAGTIVGPIRINPSTQRKWSDEDLVKAVANNTTISGILYDLGLSLSPGHYKRIRIHCQRLNLDLGHINGKPNRSFTGNTLQLSDILVEHSTYSNNSNLRRRLLAAGLIKEICNKCGLGPLWQGEKLVLQLEHKNGDSTDYRLDNLCLLCPNCHSQTATYARAYSKMGRYSQPANKCIDCGKKIDKSAIRCNHCNGLKNTHIEWPPAVDLEKEVIQTSYMKVAKRLGVTDHSVRKYLNRTLGRIYRKQCTT